MERRYRGLVGALLMSLAGAAAAQAEPHASVAAPRVLTCDTTLAPESSLQVRDEASGEGAAVETVTLIDLPNGMKAVQFSVRNTRDPKSFGAILRVRYTVRWFDDCGRRVVNGAEVVDGVALDPRREEIIQSTAMDSQATRASVRIYVEN